MVTRSRQLPNSKSAGRTSATGYTSFHRSGLALGACLGMKSMGKPCAGKPHARFDEAGQVRTWSVLYAYYFLLLFSPHAQPN